MTSRDADTVIEGGGVDGDRMVGRGPYLLAVYGLSDCDARKAEGKARGVGKAGWRKARKANKARETRQACEARRAQGTQGTQGTQGGRAGRSGRVRG